MPDLIADLEFTGSAVFDPNGSYIIGLLIVVAKSHETGATLASDSCSMYGVKQ